MKGTILGIRDSVHFVFSRAGQTHPTPFDRFQRPIGHRQRDSDRPQVQFSNGSNPFEPTLFKPLSTRRWPLNFSESRPFHNMLTALWKSKILNGFPNRNSQQVNSCRSPVKMAACQPTRPVLRASLNDGSGARIAAGMPITGHPPGGRRQSPASAPTDRSVRISFTALREPAAPCRATAVVVGATGLAP